MTKDKLIEANNLIVKIEDIKKLKAQLSTEGFDHIRLIHPNNNVDDFNCTIDNEFIGFNVEQRINDFKNNLERDIDKELKKYEKEFSNLKSE